MPSFEGNRGTKKLKETCHIMKHFDDWVYFISAEEVNRCLVLRGPEEQRK